MKAFIFAAGGADGFKRRPDAFTGEKSSEHFYIHKKKILCLRKSEHQMAGRQKY